MNNTHKFSHAFRGLRLFLGTKSAWIHVGALIVVLVAGYYFDITRTEWLALILAVGAVFAAEAFNTAIEIDMDLTSPDFHPRARDTKDVAAGAVLITAMVALVAGLVIFGPHLLALF